MAVFAKQCRQFFHIFKHRNKFLVFFDFFCVLILQNFFHAGVRHTLIYPDHGLRDLAADHFAFLINVHQAAQCQAVTACIQRTDAIGKSPWKHRDHPVYQINAGAAFFCLPVQCTVFLDVIGHIRDMHAQMPDISIFFQ